MLLPFFCNRHSVLYLPVTAAFAIARGTKTATLNRCKPLICAAVYVSPYFIPSLKKSRPDSTFCKVLSVKSVIFTERKSIKR